MFDWFKNRRRLEGEVAALRTQIQNLTVLRSDVAGMGEIFGSVPTAAGVQVTPQSAMRIAAVYACVRILAGAIASMPCNVYRRDAKARERIDHDYWWLLNESPDANWTAASFWEWMVQSVLMRGDGFAHLIRASGGLSNRIVGIKPLHPDGVEVIDDGKRLAYAYTETATGKRVFVAQEDMLHFAGLGFDGRRSMSVLQYAARNAAGTAIAAEEFAGSYYQRGATPSYVITYPAGTAPKEEQRKNLQDQFEERYSGLANAHRPLVLVNGGKAEALSVTAADAQLLESRKYQVIDIARAFGVPPHMIGETEKTSAWGSGIEQISIGFVRYVVGPIARRMQQELNRKLWPVRMGVFVEFDRDGLMAGDSKAEAEYFAKALGGPGTQGWLTINEVRAIKNMPPVKDGDQIAKAGAKPDATKEPTEPKPPKEDDDASADEGADQ